MSHKKAFYSKILLFGEYSVIKNSMALSIPYSLFEGRLTFRSDSRELSTGIDPELKAFCQYLKSLKAKGELDFDTTSFEFDIGQGLYFNSTIPQGFGAGSSGALCASIYERYTAQETNISLEELKTRFALMESHFHGSSSGMDPLISYMAKPILRSSDGGLRTVNLPSLEESKGGIFILNTGRARRTEPLVNLFLEKCNAHHFEQLCYDVLTPLTNDCIRLFLEGEKSGLYDAFIRLSQFQFDHFNPMIPKLYRDIWSAGLEHHKFSLKLCGAGGGGFLLGMTPDFKQAFEILKDYELRLLLKF